MEESPSAPSLILPTKPTASVVVLKTPVAQTSAKEIAEKAKLSLFPTLRRSILGPKPEELIQLQSIEKRYENFIRVHGVYSVRYVKGNVYPTQVEANVIEVMCGTASFKPIDRMVNIEVEERKVYKNELTLVYTGQASETKLEVIPAVDSEESPSSVLSGAKIDVKRFGRLEETVFSLATNVLKLRICEVPDEVGRIEEERLDLTEFTHVFVPAYSATFKQVKTNETKTLGIDGVTGKTQVAS